MLLMDSRTQAEKDEDAFDSWNQDIINYEPTLWDAYLFGLRRGRKHPEDSPPSTAMEYVPVTGWKS